MSDRESKIAEFVDRVEALVMEYWDVVALPDTEETDQVIEAEEMGMMDPAGLYPEGWILVTSVASIEKGRNRVLVRHQPEGQSPFLAGGMLVSAADSILE